MTPDVHIPAERLWRQYISRPFRGTPASLVQYMGAVQGQEYPFAKWALGLRLGGRVADDDIERAIEAGEILRTHVMRPTWHFVAAEDIRWLLELTGPNVLARMRAYFRTDGLDAARITKATTIVEKALANSNYLTRAELGDRLAQGGMKLTAGSCTSSPSTPSWRV